MSWTTNGLHLYSVSVLSKSWGSTWFTVNNFSLQFHNRIFNCQILVVYRHVVPWMYYGRTIPRTSGFSWCKWIQPSLPDYWNAWVWYFVFKDDMNHLYPRLPPTYMLEFGKNTKTYFNRHMDGGGKVLWSLKSIEEYNRVCFHELTSWFITIAGKKSKRTALQTIFSSS